MPTARGETFLMPTPQGLHLFVVASAPCALGKVVLVSISSWKGPRCDPTCIISAGHHHFITHDSYAAYNFSDIERCMTIDAGIAQGRFIPKGPLPEPILTSLCEGVLNSRFTPRKVKAYLQS